MGRRMALPQETNEPQSLHNQITHRVFASGLPKGAKLVERALAKELGVSRIPIRETLGRLVGQGALLGGAKGQGVRLREYSHDETQQLYEFREMIEGGAARGAAHRATEADLARLDHINEEMQAQIGDYGSARWAQLDHQFHEAMAECSRNERVISLLRSLLAECHYLFYLYPSRQSTSRPDDAVAHMQDVVNDHKELVQLIRDRKADEAEHRARADIRKSAARVARAMVAAELKTAGNRPTKLRPHG